MGRPMKSLCFFRNRPRLIRSLFAVAFMGAGAASLAFACGGTTGREDLPAQASPGAVDASVDATLDTDAEEDTGAFDVGITYVDQVLPEINAPPSNDAASGYPWPSCPPFIPVLNGVQVPLGQELDQIPASYDDAGDAEPAPDGSPCATYGWLGSTSIDDCLTSQASGGPGDYIFLPPCNWCAEAGVAVQGAGAGISQYTLCLELYECIAQTGCGTEARGTDCICGDASGPACVTSPAGPCFAQEMAALQYPTSQVQMALTNFENDAPSFLGYCAGALNNLYVTADTIGCYAAGGH